MHIYSKSIQELEEFSRLFAFNSNPYIWVHLNRKSVRRFSALYVVKQLRQGRAINMEFVITYVVTYGGQEYPKSFSTMIDRSSRF